MASVAIDDRQSWPHECAIRLYEEHTEWLRRYCARQLGGSADAEDAVQTTFLYAFRALRRGVVPECERAWLTTIARNVCHSHRRTRERHPEAAPVDLDRIALAQPDLEEAGFLDEVRAALAALTENQRRALVLREWHGASSSEIAAELHLSEPATHALLFRARRSFANAISASRRGVAGLNVAAVVEALRGLAKTLLGSAAGKAAVVTAAAGVAVGGAVVEQRLDDPTAPPPVRPAGTTPVDQGSGEAATTLSVAPLEPRSVDRPSLPVRVLPQQGAWPVAPAAAPVDTAERFQQPPTRPADTPSSASPPSRAAPPQTAPPAPAPAPPVEPPVPAPVDLPPILGEEPPIELPPPLDELLPPVELPPVDPPPLPAPPLPPLP